MKVKVQPFKQEGTQLYSGIMRAKDIIRLGEVDVYREEDGTFVGYQRNPEPTRTRLVAQYLKNTAKPLLPTSILLSYRSKLEVKGDYIDLPEGAKIYIVDGQHRIYGIKRAIDEMQLERYLDYELPVVIIENLKPEDEANQFRIINETMKKVRTDLARRILALRFTSGDTQSRREIRSSGRDWEASAAEVINILSLDKDSPWFGKIQPPNTKKSQNHIIRELSFSTSLKPVLNQRPYNMWPPKRVADKLKLLWLAFNEIMPEPFNNPNDYVIQKTPGVFSIHMLAFSLLEELRVNGITDPTVDDFKNIIENLGDYITPEYWIANNAEGAAMAGSMKGFSLIADDMVLQLQAVGKLAT